MSDVYYPALSSLITIDQLPDNLSSITSGLETIFDNIYFRNLISTKSINRCFCSYKLEIICFSQALKLEIPGTGVTLILNPDFNDPSVDYSVIPLTVSWNFGILKYLGQFNFSNFSFKPEDFFNVILQIIQVSQSTLLLTSANTYIDDLDPLTKFATDTNAEYSNIHIPLPLDPDTTLAVNSILLAIQQSNVTLNEILLTHYIIDVTSDVITLQNLEDLFSQFLGFNVDQSIRSLLVPQVTASIELTAGLEIPRSVLLPVRPDGTVEPNPDILTTLLFDIGQLSYNSDLGFNFKNSISVSLPSTYPKAQIGDTGIVLGFTQAMFISGNGNSDLNSYLGYPSDFTGLYIQKVTVDIPLLGQNDPGHTSVKIFGENLLIGSGGFSGTIGLVDNGSLYRKFGDFAIELDAFSITFRQNAIVGCAISGKLTLPAAFSPDPGNPTTLEIDITIKDAGDFTVMAKPIGTLPSFTLTDVFTVTLRSLELGEKNGRFFIAVAGSLDFIADVPVLGQVLPKGININKLLIYDDGQLEFEGGGLVVPKAFKISIPPAKMEVSHLSLSAYTRKLNGIDRNYTVVGFDGMVNTGAIGIEAQGNGIKYYFTNDTDVAAGKPFDSFLSIQQLEIDIIIPDDATEDSAAVIIEGTLSMKNPDPAVSASTAATEFTGKVTFEIPKLRIGGSAGMRLTPSIPAFVVDLGLELPVAIPLGPTGLGIYAIRGLIGQHYIPSKTAVTGLTSDSTWWDYYKAPQEGININKFADESGFSLGAGISLATDVSDSGYIFSAKLFVLLNLPNVFLIQGQADILHSRLGLDDHVDPPFQALIVFSDDSVLGNLSVDFNLPDTADAKGFILSLQAQLSLGFFFNNASGWYINIGKDTPASAQVQAKILALFRGHAYLMISSQGVKAGAGASFDFNKTWGPVGVSFNAYLNMGGALSFKPVQIGGFINVGGGASIHLSKIGLSIAIDILLAVEAPHPFNISGKFSFKVKVLLFKVSFTLELGWHFNQDNAALIPIPVLSLPDGNGYAPVAAINILTNEAFPVNYVISDNVSGTIPAPGDAAWAVNFLDTTAVMGVVIPLDSFIDIGLLKAVLPGNILIGGAANEVPSGYSELIPPQKGIAAQVKHQYGLKAVNIFAWGNDGTKDTWMPYNVFEAVTAIVNGTAGSGIDLTKQFIGYWQFASKDTFNKVRLLSQSTFSYLSTSVRSTGSDLDANNFNAGDLFCFDSLELSEVVDWVPGPTGTIYADGSSTQYESLTFNFSGTEGEVIEEASFGNLALKLSGGQGNLDISLPEPVTTLELELGDNHNSLIVNFSTPVWSVGDYSQVTETDDVVLSVPVAATTQGFSVTTPVGWATPFQKVSLLLDTPASPGYTGDLIMGGHFPLAPQFYGALDPVNEIPKSLLFVTLYNLAVAAADVPALPYRGNAGTVLQWPMDSTAASVGGLAALISGSPDLVPGFFEADGTGAEQLHPVYSFASGSDSLEVPYDPLLAVENGSFSFEVTALFSPFAAGISTLLSRVSVDETSGYRKGFALHLLQNQPGKANTAYTGTVPSFVILLTCHDGTSVSGITANEFYSLDCATSQLSSEQYKRVLVTVDRTAGLLAIYIDRQLKYSGVIPAELVVPGEAELFTFLNRISYTTAADQQRLTDAAPTPEAMENEIALLNNSFGASIQAVWRPDTVFAVQLVTEDIVGGHVNDNSHVFGFKTAGPIGHFHQESAIYQALAAQDQADAFKLANLQVYIDYNRSFPDAQGRYNLSKPVYYQDPQVRLFFVEPYLNAMFSDFDAYQGLPEVASSLNLQFIDPAGNLISPVLTEGAVEIVPISDANYQSFSADLQALYLFNKAAIARCGATPVQICKKIQHEQYDFPDLEPGQLYTALFNAVYQPAGLEADTAEVHRFSFITSRYPDLATQAGSYIDALTGAYSVYRSEVSFNTDYIENTLLLLVDGNPDNDPAAVLQYAQPYDRLVFGGLLLPAPEAFDHTVIQLVVNTNPDDASRMILGLMIYNPEPFNDPKLPAADLADTVSMTLDSDPGPFIYIHSGDNSAVFITNAAMNVAPGNMALTFLYKEFNGDTYDVTTWNGPPFDTTPYFNA